MSDENTGATGTIDAGQTQGIQDQGTIESPAEVPASQYRWHREEPAERAKQETRSADDHSGESQEKQVSEPEPKAAPKFDDRLRERAKAYGYGDSDLEAMADSEALEADMARLDRLMARDLRAQRDQKNNGQNNGQIQGPADHTARPTVPAQPTAPSNQPPVPDGAFAFDPEFISGLDEKASGEFRRLTSHYHEREQRMVQDFRKALAERDSALATVSNNLARELARWHVLSAGESFKDVIADPANVDKAIDEAEVLAMAYRQRGIPVPSLPELVRRGLVSAFGKPVKQQAVQDLRDQVRNERGQFTARPTSREAAAPAKGREAAMAFAEKTARKLGLE